MIKRLFILAILIGFHLLISYYAHAYGLFTALAAVGYLLYFFQKLSEAEVPTRYTNITVCCPLCKNYIHLPNAPVVPKGLIEFRCDTADCGVKISFEFTQENYDKCDE